MRYKKMTQKEFDKIIKAHDCFDLSNYYQIKKEVIKGYDLSKICMNFAYSNNVIKLKFKKCLVNQEFNVWRHDNILKDCKLDCEVPESGQFFAWKAVYINDKFDNQDFCYAKLLIPKSAKRTGCLQSAKCRASKAKILGFYNRNQKELDIKKAYSWHNIEFAYHKGKTVIPDSYDGNILEECTTGIHFFMDIKDAIAFGKL